MHIPDGFLDARTGVASAALAVSGVGIALRRARRTLPPSHVPLMGLAAAFVFAAQMVNFPIAGGTSGHLMGGALVAVLLGPSAAVIVLTSVLLVQCLVFADGGVLALGANVFNMALVGSLIGGTVYQSTARFMSRSGGIIAAASFAGWCSMVSAAWSCAAQLAFAGAASWKVLFPAMTGIHMLIGLGEGFITGLVVAGLLKIRPDLFVREKRLFSPGHRSSALAYGLLLLAGLSLFLAPFASPWPDGLEHVAEKLGFSVRALETPLSHTPLANYSVSGWSGGWGSTLVAGAIGTLLAFSLSLLMGRWLGRQPPVTASTT
jgi:cobalt/nickel transport system permease protein